MNTVCSRTGSGDEPIVGGTTGHAPKNYAKWMKSELACVLCRPLIRRFESGNCLAAAIGAPCAGMSVWVI